jgi:outer membrane protein assembly factor BamB
MSRLLGAVAAGATLAACVACGGDDETAVTPSESASLPSANDTSEDADGTLLAIDARTGQELWRVRPPGGAVSQPVAADGQVFVVTANNCTSLGGSLVAYDAATGEEQWRAPSGGGCFFWSTSARRGIVLAPGENNVQGLDAATGKSRWSVERRERTDWTLIDGDNLVVVVEFGPDEARFRALDRLTGQERWVAEMTLPGRFTQMLASSTSVLFLKQPFGGQAGGSPLTALDLETGEQRWAASVGGAGTSDVGLATSDELVFVRFGEYEVLEEALNTVAAFDARAGEEIWRHQERGDPFAVQLAAADGSVYFSGTGESGVAITALDIASGAVRWQSPGIGFGQEPVAAGDGVVVLTISEELRGRVLAFDATDGSRLWEMEVPPSHTTLHATAVSGGVVYVSIWGEVPAFGD